MTMHFSANMGCAEAELGAFIQRFRLVSGELELSFAQLSLVLGTSEERLRSLSVRVPPPAGLEAAMRRFVDLVDHASLLFGGRMEASQWLRIPHPLLKEGRSPLDLLMEQPRLLQEVCRQLRLQCAEEGLLSEPAL